MITKGRALWWVLLLSAICSTCLTQPLAGQAVPDELQRARQAETRRIDLIQHATRSFVSVFAANGQGGGSGVIVSPDGYALTNFHVVKPCGTYMHCAMPNGQLYDAVLVGIDPTGDVAMIKLVGREDFPVASLGNSDEVRVGDDCFAVGNPFLLATDFQPTVTWGIVSGVHRYQYPAGTLLEYADCIQTDAAINPGNSGGPLFNGRGELIGINGRGSFEKRGRVNVGVGYAISINQIKLFRDHLASGRIVDHATLGATVSTDARGRVVVDNILPSSDAFRRGLRYDDEIVSLAGRSIQTVNELKNVLGIYPKGWRVPLEFRRDHQLFAVSVRLAGVHSAQQLVELVAGRPGDFRPPSPEDPQPHDPQQPPDEKPKTKHRSRDKTTIPSAAQELIEHKPGFANFYFNRIRTEEIWHEFSAHGAAHTDNEQWQMTARLADGIPVTVILGQQGSGLRLADEASVLDPEFDLGQQLVPSGSGGMLPALHLWQRLLQKGPAAYGDVYYLGRLPVSETYETAHVLVATYDVMRSYFYFDENDSQLLGLDMWSSDDRDPCEIRFADYRQVGGKSFPMVMTVKHGDQFKWVLHIDEISMESNDP